MMKASEARAQAEQEVAQLALPMLIGTERQVAYATDIRRERLIKTYYNFIFNDPEGASHMDRERVLALPTEAAWWISRRDHLSIPELRQCRIKDAK